MDRLEIGKRIVGKFLQSEAYQSYSSENANDLINDPERANRCYEAASEGCDGGTHAERIDDMRGYWQYCLNRSNLERVDAAVCAYLDSLEAWHESNGTLWQEVG